MSFNGMMRFATVCTALWATGLASAGVVGFYSFNGDANDSSGNGNNGVITGTPTFVSGAPFGGQAISFDGVSNSYVTVPIDIRPQDMPQMSFGGWVSANSLTVTSAVIRGILSNDDGSFDRTIDVDNRAGGLRWTVFTGGTGLAADLVTADQWIFIAAVYDQAAQTFLFDVNGTVYSGVTNFDSNSVATGMTIGRNPNFDSPFGGQLANVFVMNQALTISQLHDIRVNGPSEVFALGAAPEPASMGLIGAGLTGLALLLRRRRS